MENFIILIGGPGLYWSCDPVHDKRWSNYFRTVMIATAKNLIKRRGKNEKVHWVVYEPAYKKRWLDDSDMNFLQYTWESLISGRELHITRQGHADEVKSYLNKINIKHANYINFIKSKAGPLDVNYIGINHKDEFWKFIDQQEQNSITRVWFCGHAVNDLWLELTHGRYEDDDCAALSPEPKAIVSISDIDDHSKLKDRFKPSADQISKFYGCNTAAFAESWAKTFGVKSEGANTSITFKGIFGNELGILKRIETTPIGGKATEWNQYQP